MFDGNSSFKQIQVITVICFQLLFVQRIRAGLRAIGRKLDAIRNKGSQAADYSATNLGNYDSSPFSLPCWRLGMRWKREMNKVIRKVELGHNFQVELMFAAWLVPLLLLLLESLLLLV